MAHTQLIISFCIYFFILLSIGWLFHKKQVTETQFVLGNRSLNFWLTAFSAHASDMSAWLFMAFPSAIYMGGLPQCWAAFGLIAGMFLNWQYIAEKLRRQTEKYHSNTLPSYFESRFADKTGTIRFLTAFMSVIYLTCYLSAGLIAMGFLFESVFGLDYTIGLVISTVVAVTYMFLGGYMTIAWVDLFQALFLLMMILLVPLIGFFSLPDGLHTIEAAAKSGKISLSFFEKAAPVLLLSLGWGLGYFGQPHILTKFMGIKDPKMMYKSKYVGMSWQIMALGASCFVGFVGIGFFAIPLNNPELVYVEMVKKLFHPLTGGFVLCALLAANISTMDSQILVCASVISEDFYKHFVHPKAPEKRLLIISRAAVIFVAFIALLIAFQRSSTVLETVLYAWSGLGSAFGPLIFASLYSSKVNRFGAVAGILVGGIFSGIWPSLNPFVTAAAIPPLIPSFFLSLFSIFFVSRWYRAK